MNFKREARFAVFIAFTILLWLPVAAWIMPRFGAPSWHESPGWYFAATLLLVPLLYVLRWADKRLGLSLNISDI